MATPVDSTFEVRLLGHFEVVRNGKAVPPSEWSRRKTQMLFKIFLTFPGRVLTQDQLIEYLFPDHDPDSAAKNVYNRISELRRILEPSLKTGRDSTCILRTGPGDYSLSKEIDCWVDTTAFQQQIESAQELEETESWRSALKHYQRAVALYRGDYLEEDLYEEWTIHPREQWREQYLFTLEHLATCHAQLRQYREAIQSCQQAIELAPERESLYREKMSYHYHAGEQSQALRTYESCVQALKDDLGVEPTQETRALCLQIRNHQVPPPESAIPNNLPHQLTSFIGRKREIEEVKSRLSSDRLLTIVGVGGCGKTRLVLQVAAGVIEHYPHGVWLVELAPLSDPMLVLQAVAITLGLKESKERTFEEALIRYLEHKHLLLVLDNCEHLLSSCAQLADTLLRACSGVCILASSREGLGITGETTWHVTAMSLPDSNGALDMINAEELMRFEAVKLFVERAKTAVPSFRLTTQNAPGVLEVCQRLDGIPLAIELAAARVKILSPNKLAARLDERFRLLTGGSRSALPRQQTLKAAMDWSYELLTEAEQVLWNRLTVFRGDFSLEAAEEVCAGGELEKQQILDLLHSMAEKSLLEKKDKGLEPRYWLLETVREYGRDKLVESGETAAVRRHHLDFFLSLAQEAESFFWEGRTQAASGLKQKVLEYLNMAPEYENMRSAMAWSLEGAEAEKGARLACILRHTWHVMGLFSEAKRWLRRAVETAEAGPPELQAKAQLAFAYALSGHGYSKEAKQWIIPAISLYEGLDDQRNLANSINVLGIIEVRLGNTPAGLTHLEESLALHQQIDCKRGMGLQYNNLAVVAQHGGDIEKADRLIRKALQINRELGNRTGEGLNLSNLSFQAMMRNDFQAAKTRCNEALQIAMEAGNRQDEGNHLNLLGMVALHEGDYCGSRIHFEHALSLNRDTDNTDHELRSIACLGLLSLLEEDLPVAKKMFVQGLGICHARGMTIQLVNLFTGLSSLALAEKEPVLAAQYLGITKARLRSIEILLDPLFKSVYDQIQSDLEETMDKAAFEKAVAEGENMPFDEAIELCLG